MLNIAESFGDVELSFLTYLPVRISRSGRGCCRCAAMETEAKLACKHFPFQSGESVCLLLSDTLALPFSA